MTTQTPRWNRLVMPVLATACTLGSLGFVSPDSATTTFRTHGATRARLRVLRPDLAGGTSHFAVGAAAVTTDALTGAPRLLKGKLLPTASFAGGPVTLDDLLADAERYLAAHGAELGVSMSDLSLDQNAVLLAKDVQFLKFRVHRDGLLVRDASVDFRFQKGQLHQVSNQSYAEAAVDERPALNGLDQDAARAVIGSSPEARGEHYRVVREDGGYKLVRVSAFDVQAQDGKRFEVSVEQATGKVFELRPKAFYLAGTASGDVYPRWYGEPAQTLPYRDITLSYAGGTITADANGNYTGAPPSAHPELKGFVGKHVRISTQSGTAVDVVGASRGNAWDVTFARSANAAASEDKDMAQSMTYYHLNKEINHAKQYISTPWLDKQLLAKVNQRQTCNAFWDGESVNLFQAGNGCANTALISDVFYHEWGHGLDENTGGIEDDAFSEGFGDTMALLMTHSSILGKGFKVADGSPVRELTTLLVYPADADQADPHKEGLIIAGSFWDLFLSLKDTYGEDKAGDILSNLALKVVFTASKYTDVYDALLEIDGADTSAARSPNFCAINKAFARHGLAKKDATCR